MKRLFQGAVLALFVFSVTLVMVSGDAEAIPTFARKYNVECSMCHTIVPKLNRTGYEFRLAGYRMPDQIGEDASSNFKLGNFFSARIQAGYKYTNHNDHAKNSDWNNSDLYFKEFTMYPLSGSWGKNFGSLAEISMAPGDSPELENAYVRYVNGNKDAWWQARAGLMHAWEGFGASDRPLGLSRPMFQTNSGAGAFTPWTDEMAAEVGYNMATTGTSVALRMSNGITQDGGPAQSIQTAGGDTFKKDSSITGHNDKSYSLVVNQFINDDSAMTLYYYRGNVPYTATNKDTFTRFAAYANFWALPDQLNLLAGYGWGKDDLADSSAVDLGKSKGYFVETDYHVSPTFALAARFDKWDPSNKNSDDKVSAITLSGNVFTMEGLQLISEYQHKKSDVTGGGNDKDDSINLRMIYIW
ncbi:MAG: hypothetical protein GXP58_03685 [Deltaproteobacteria bacterium]|nr:hypothetical protein [Deltaproteobacteria bacterium]